MRSLSGDETEPVAAGVAATVGRNLELFEHAARGIERVFDLEVVGRLVRIRLAGPALDSILIEALRHKAIPEQDSEPELTICAWDGRSTGVGADLDGISVVRDEQETRTLVRGQKGFLVVQGSPIWAAQGYDAARRMAFLWASEPSVLSRWGSQTKPFLEILHAWLIDSPWQLIHGGAVGGADGGVLLAGASGAGKSTTVMSCVRAGWRYAGDDYLAIRTNGAEAFVENLYASARLRADMAERFGVFRSAEVGAVFLNGIEKRDMMLSRMLPRTRFGGFPIRAILLPRVTGAARSRLRPAGAAEAMAAIGPTTLVFLRVGAESAFEKISRIPAAAPAYWAELGEDIEDLPATISSETGVGPG